MSETDIGYSWPVCRFGAYQFCPTAPPVLLQQPEDRQERGKQRIALFRSLFRGRTDVYAKRWTSADGRSG